MDSIKNYGLSGVNQTVELGKVGAKISSDASNVSLTDNAGALLPAEVADGTSAAHTVSLQQLQEAEKSKIKVFSTSVNYNSGESEIITLPANTVVLSTTVEKGAGNWTGYDANTEILVGDSSVTNRLYSNFDPGEQTIGETNVVYTDETTITASVTAGGATAGTATITIMYSGLGVYSNAQSSGGGTVSTQDPWTAENTTLLHTLDNPNAYGTSVGDQFGYSVAISGNYAIVGVYREGDAGGVQSGKAYIFDVTDGTLVHTLDNPNDYGTSASDNFGYSVAISGNYAIVGAYREDGAGGSDYGRAYIFDVTTGALLHTLDNPNAYGTSAGDRFGHRVAISDNYAIVGAYAEDDAGGSNSGKAYIYNVTTGALLHTLDNPNDYGTSANDFFGFSVGISGDYAIVGAYRENDAGGTESGKAYIFNVTTGALLHTLDNPNPYSTSTNDYFGASVAISGNYAIVGAHLEDEASGLSSGKAYIYNVTTGDLLYTLDNPNADSTITSDQFGVVIDIDGDYAIVGVQAEGDAGGTYSGKAYIFDVTNGTLVHTLDNPNDYSTSAGDQFGYSVAISGNYAIVGANREDGAGGSDYGRAYIFTNQ